MLRPLGSRYCLRNFLVTHLTASSSFHLSVIGSFHFPGLHAFHCKLLAWSSVSKQHSTCLPEAPQNPQSRPYSAIILRDFAASRANCPGTHWPEDPERGRRMGPAEAGTHLKLLLIKNQSYALILVDQLQNFDLEPVALDSEQVNLLACSGIALDAILNGSDTP